MEPPDDFWEKVRELGIEIKTIPSFFTSEDILDSQGYYDD